MGNPLIPITTGTDQGTSVPSTALPEYEQFTLATPSGALALPALQTSTPPISGSQTSVSAGDILSAATAVAQAAAGVATGGAIGGGIGSIASGSVVTIVLGILFIAAGIFSFRAPREIAIQAAKAAA